MKQLPLNIRNFEIGDIIVRIQPSTPMGNSESRKDRSYIGKPMKFLGVANGCIYTEKVKSDEPDEMPDMFNLAEMLSMFTGDSGPISLPLDIWEEGWSKYIDPYSIGSGHFEEEIKEIAIEELERMYKAALEAENYEKADKLKKLIKGK